VERIATSINVAVKRRYGRCHLRVLK